MKQGYSGSTVQRKGDLVEKTSSDLTFIQSNERQADLIALSRGLAILPDIIRIAGESIAMEFVEGEEGLTIDNAKRTGGALRLLHAQGGYPHACMTGVEWLFDLTNVNLAKIGRHLLDKAMLSEYPDDALIHSEPVQFIEKKDGSIVFIDFEGIGMGSRYQDLGFIYYIAERDHQPEIYDRFQAGYQPGSTQIEPERVRQMAGLISCAYASFYDFELRMDLGLRLFK